MLTSEQISRLIDIGYAACHKGLTEKARTVFEGVLADRPGHVPAQIGLAYSHMTVNEFDKAEEILCGQVLAGNPQDADGLAYLGLCRLLAGRRDEARETLEKVPADAPGAGALAAKLLDQLQG